MSHRRKKYLSAGLAGVLCSTALLGIAMADDRDRGRETEREMEMGTETEAEKCLLPGCFLSRPPLRHRPMPHANRLRSWVKKVSHRRLR